MNQEKTYVRYSESFKLEIVRAVRSGKSVSELRKAYGISGSGTIRNWIKKYGAEDLLAKKILVMKPKEQKKEEQLQSRIKELEAALVNLQLEKIEAEAFLSVACKRLGEQVKEFKKKNAKKD